MARVSIEIPEVLEFSVELPVLISHINRADHLGNDSLVGLLNEARVRYLDNLGMREWNASERLLVNADLAVQYQSEVRYGEGLRLELGIGERFRYGFDILYRVSEVGSGRPVALAKTAHVLIDTGTGKPVDASDLHRTIGRG